MRARQPRKAVGGSHDRQANEGAENGEERDAHRPRRRTQERSAPFFDPHHSEGDAEPDQDVKHWRAETAHHGSFGVSFERGRRICD